MVEERQKIRVLIADQQPVFRQGIRSFLNQIADIDVCGEVGSSSELMSAIDILYPDVALVDTELSKEDYVDIAKTVKQLKPSVAVILLSRQPNDDELFQAIKARATGYLRRGLSSDELVAQTLGCADSGRVLRKSVHGGFQQAINSSYNLVLGHIR